jgi:hypothetical protein
LTGIVCQPTVRRAPDRERRRGSEETCERVCEATGGKDQRTPLEATARAASSHDKLQLVLVGSGPLERALYDATRSLGLVERVTFAGSRDDVAKLLPAFDVFALSSRNEGLEAVLRIEDVYRDAREHRDAARA